MLKNVEKRCHPPLFSSVFAFSNLELQLTLDVVVALLVSICPGEIDRGTGEIKHPSK